MRGGTRTGPVVLLAVVVLAPVLVGGSAAQTDQPAWADDLFEDIQTAADRFNAKGGADDVGNFERWLVQNARVNLYVRGDDGSTAVYSFRIDERLQVAELRQGKRDDRTLRVRTSRAIVERIAAAGDRDAVIRQEVQRGRIRVERVFEPVRGLVIAVGVVDVLVGATGLLLVTLGVLKFGAEGLLAAIWGAIQNAISTLARASQNLWRNLGGIATGLTILEKLGVLDDVKRGVRKVRNAIRTAVNALVGRVRRVRPGNEKEKEETEKTKERNR